MRRVLCVALFLLSALPCAAQELKFDGDYVMWWLRRSYLPPILTDGTRIVYGDERLETRHADRFIGGRFAVEYGPVEVRAFFLERDSTYRTIKPIPTPLAFTYTDGATGRPATEQIAGNGLVGGFVGYSRVELFGEEVNGVIPLSDGEGWRVDLLAGARFLQMRDRYHHTATSRNAGPAGGFEAGAILTGVIDNVRSHNAFYGAQVGVRGEMDMGRWFVNGRAAAALGADDQQVRSWGERTYHTPAGRVVTPGGLFVRASNTGKFSRCAVDGVGELALNVGCRLTERVSVSMGYTFLLWLDPIRATELDTVIDTRAGATRPGVQFKGEPFWAQGVNVGLNVRW